MFRLWFIHWTIVSPFIHHCFPFSDWWIKKWEIAEEVSMNCTAYTYYITLMAKCTCTWLYRPLKLLLSTFFALYRFKLARMTSCCDLYACSWAVIWQCSCCYNRYQASTTIVWKIVSAGSYWYWFTLQTTQFVTFYAWTNRFTFFYP